MRKNLFQTCCVLLLILLKSVNAVAGDENLVFYSYDASNGLADNSVQIVRCTRTGRVLIFTIGHVNFFDGDNFTHIDPSERDVIKVATRCFSTSITTCGVRILVSWHALTY